MTEFTLPEGATIDEEGVWCQVLESGSKARRAALFLDRDGVVVDEVHYLRRAHDVRLVAGAAPVIAEANRRNLAVVLVTNQAGIGRGILGWPEFALVQERIIAELTAAGATLDAVYACPHHARGQAPYDHPDHPARKPNPGMLLRAITALTLDAAASWIIGDRASDLEAGRAAGLMGGLHVRTGYGERPGEREAALALADRRFQSLGAASIADTVAQVSLFA
ncbi:MAG: HAD-IIIA family hydrolase [Rhodospirillales bacterium]|jgi:D-glycero-D-manno-heptose 1,7-bisphosphate phosphatase|nr:HAD-IIIA family hydrolase [Rhodospirillales bacterium]